MKRLPAGNRRSSPIRPSAERVPPRVYIEGVSPEIDGGRYPIKRTVGETVLVEADIFAEGHDRIAAVLLHRQAGEEDWREIAMTPLPNDRWQAAFDVTEVGIGCYTIEAWIDVFASWRAGLARRSRPGRT